MTNLSITSSAVSAVPSTPPTPKNCVDDVSKAIYPASLSRRLGTIALVLIAAWLVWFLISNPRFEWPVVWNYLFAPAILEGLGVTLALTVISMVGGVLVGTIAALLLMSDYGPGRRAANVYLWAFRATPLMIQLLFWYNLAYLLPTVSIGLPFGEPWAEWRTIDLINPFTAAVLGLSLAEGAYMAEIMRAGLLSVDQRQHDAAKAIGMTPAQSFFRIIVPQAMRFIIPPTGNQVISMAKATALVSVIAMNDLLFAVQTIYNRTYEIVPLLMVAVFWYLVVISCLYLIQSRLEKHYSKGHQRTAVITAETTTA